MNNNNFDKTHDWWFLGIRPHTYNDTLAQKYLLLRHILAPALSSSEMLRITSLYGLFASKNFNKMSKNIREIHSTFITSEDNCMMVTQSYCSAAPPSRDHITPTIGRHIPELHLKYFYNHLNISWHHLVQHLSTGLNNSDKCF